MYLNSPARLIVIFILTLVILCSLNLSTTYAQPNPWPLKIAIEQNEYYLGEDGIVRMNITNYACTDRVDRKEILTWSNQERSVIDPYVKRAEEMMSEGRILNYVLEGTNQYVIGDKEYGDYKLSLLGVCVGDSIDVQSVAIWFSWKGFGRALISSVEKHARLSTFDAAKYVVNGQHAESSMIVELVFPFPSTLPPELVPTDMIVPNIEVTMRLPSGTVWTFDRGFKITGGLTIIPSRTFNIKIMDNTGETPVPSGILRIQALIHTYYLREYVFSEGSEILIERLPDEYDYLVVVLYNSTYTGTEEVYRAVMNSYELAKSGVLKTNLYSVRIMPLDLLGRSLEGAQVYLNQVSSMSKEGIAFFPLVPAGNYSVKVEWMGEEVLDKWLWIGYHSTLNPSGVVPEVISLVTAVGDLVVQASDAEGTPIGADFRVSGPGVSSFVKYESDGLLVMHQLPLAEYQIIAKNYSKVIESEVSMSVLLTPGKGETSIIKLPVYRVDLRVLTIDKKPIVGAVLNIGKLTTKTGLDGEAKLGAVPSGEYHLTITYNDEKILEDSILIGKTGRIELVTKACSVKITIKDVDGNPQPVYWRLTGPKKEYNGYGDSIETPILIDEDHKLTIMLWQDKPPIVEKNIKPSEMITGEILLPVSKMRIAAKWSFGEPMTEGLIIIRSETYNLTRRLTINSQITETQENLPFTEYVIRLYLPSGQEIASEKREFNGSLIELTIPSRTISVTVRDVLGQPIPGAVVEIYYNNYFIEKAVAGQDGTAVIRRIPTYIAGQILVSVSQRDVKVEKYVPTSQAQITITLDAVKLGLALIPLNDFIIYIVIIAGLLMILPSISITKKLFRKKSSLQESKTT